MNKVFIQEVRSRFIKARLELGKSQKGISKVSGVSTATISLFEAGKVDPGIVTVISILEAVGLSLSIVDLDLPKSKEDLTSQT